MLLCKRVGGPLDRSRLVRVKYTVVRSSTPKRTVIYFEADNTEDTFLPKEYNSIEMR